MVNKKHTKYIQHFLKNILRKEIHRKFQRGNTYGFSYLLVIEACDQRPACLLSIEQEWKTPSIDFLLL